MTTSKTHTGAIKVTDIVDGYLVTQMYFGYTIYQAKRLFKKHVESIKKQLICNQKQPERKTS